MVIVCSFILKSLHHYNITEDALGTILPGVSERIEKRINDTGEDYLVMLLSGMGGTGKSEVTKAFDEFIEGIRTSLV